MAEPFKIIICGEGGQGVLSIAKTLTYAAWLQGRWAVYVPYFSTEKRGGVSVAYAQIGDEEIAFPKFHKADLWVALSQRAVHRIEDALGPETWAMVNSSLVHDLSAIADRKPYEVDAGRIATEQLNKSRAFNMVILGAMVALTPGLEKEPLGKALENTFKDKYLKDPSLRELNAKAVEIGYGLVKH